MRWASNLVLLGALIPGALAQSSFTVSGLVRATGPVAGATVNFVVLDGSNRTLADFNVITAADGRFSANVPASRIHLRVEPPPEANLFVEQIYNITIDRNLDITIPLVTPVQLNGRWSPPPGRSARSTIEAFSLNRRERMKVESTDGTFTFNLRPGDYSLHVWPADPATEPVRLNVEARQPFTSVVIPSTGASPLPLRDPPRLALIHATVPDAAGRVVVSGEAASVAPRSLILIANLQTGHINTTVSDVSGAFSAPLFAPPGSFIEIKHDPTGRYLFSFPSQEVPAGTVLYVPEPVGTIRAIGAMWQSVQFDITRYPFLGAPDPGTWIFSAPFESSRWQAGSSFTLTGTLSLLSKDLESSSQLAGLKVSGELTLERVFDAEGRHGQLYEDFTSRSLTPSGFPHDNIYDPATIHFEPIEVGAIALAGSGKAEAPFSVKVALPPTAAAGHYRFLISLQYAGLPAMHDHPDAFPISERGIRKYSSGGRIVKIGNPATPRITWILALNESSNGARGVVASEDSGRFAMAMHVMFAPAEFILPRVDPRTGETITYRLEPFAPMIACSNGDLPDPPQVPFRFPSGSFHVEVIAPDGSRDDLGAAPFEQPAFRSPASRYGFPISGESHVTNHTSDYYELSTMTTRFDYRFARYGRHQIRATGQVQDVWGNTYAGDGTFDIHIARTLRIDPAVIPGTPFEVGDRFTPSVTLTPPLPAAVDVQWKLLPQSDEAKAVTEHWQGRANRFGFFRDSAGTTIPAAGETRIDVRATYLDATGTYWMGSAAWGNVVETPSSGVILHGRRGFQDARERGDRWMQIRNADRGAGHLMFPFESGDVMWMDKDDNAAAAPALSLQDPAQKLSPRLRQIALGRNLVEFDLRNAIGELPLFSECRRADCLQAYWYAYVERPGVHVRELVSEDNMGGTYWRFHDRYQNQIGVGASSDLPNEFKFQFGGSVFRDPAMNLFWYGAYASLFILLPPDDATGGRIMPPFQGNGGGPSGGPLFRLKGKDVDIFFHPTAVRAGSILHTGEQATFAGYSAPTLPSRVEIVVTSPSGVTRTIGGQANRIGYFYDPQDDFRITEAGVWRAKTKITFEGRTSAGQLTAPFPTGTVLGSREGEFYFYAVDSTATPLEVTVSSGTLRTAAGGVRFVRPADGPIAFSVIPPPGLTNVELTTSTSMPGFVLEERRSGSLTYIYDARALAVDFPNLDLNDADGLAGADVVTISFLLSAIDASGARKHFARQIVLQGEELQMPEQKETIAPSRRRAVRR